MTCPRAGKLAVTASSGNSIGYPPGQAGDLLVLSLHASNLFGATPPADLPPGWTNVGTATGDNTNTFISYRLCWKIATGAESGSLTITPGSDYASHLMARLRPMGDPYGGAVSAIGNATAVLPVASATVAAVPTLMLAFVGIRYDTGVFAVPVDGMCHQDRILGGAYHSSVTLAGECFGVLGPTGTRQFTGWETEPGAFWGRLLVPSKAACLAEVPPLRGQQRDNLRSRQRGSQQLSDRAGWANAYL